MEWPGSLVLKRAIFGITSAEREHLNKCSVWPVLTEGSVAAYIFYASTSQNKYYLHSCDRPLIKQNWPGWLEFVSNTDNGGIPFSSSTAPQQPQQGQFNEPSVFQEILIAALSHKIQFKIKYVKRGEIGFHSIFVMIINFLAGPWILPLLIWIP